MIDRLVTVSTRFLNPKTMEKPPTHLAGALGSPHAGLLLVSEAGQVLLTLLDNDLCVTQGGQ